MTEVTQKDICWGVYTVIYKHAEALLPPFHQNNIATCLIFVFFNWPNFQLENTSTALSCQGKIKQWAQILETHIQIASI